MRLVILKHLKNIVQKIKPRKQITSTLTCVAPPKGGTVKTFGEVKHQNKMGLHNIYFKQTIINLSYIYWYDNLPDELLLGLFYSRLNSLHRPLSRVLPQVSRA